MPTRVSFIGVVAVVTLVLLGCPPAAKDAQSSKATSKEKAKDQKQPASEPPFRSGGW